MSDAVGGAVKAPLLSKADILARQDRAFRDIEVPEWGGSVRIAALSTGQAMQFQGLQRESVDRGLGWLLVRTIVAEDFTPLFDDSSVDALLGKSFAATERLMYAALELNNLGSKTEDARKNSSGDQSDASHSA